MLLVVVVLLLKGGRVGLGGVVVVVGGMENMVCVWVRGYGGVCLGVAVAVLRWEGGMDGWMDV